MKTELPKDSQGIQRYLNKVIKIVLRVTSKKLAKIIVFGSYARGDWVEDVYRKDGRLESYQSDLDVILIFKKGTDAGYKSHKIEKNIEILLDKYIYSDYEGYDLVPGRPEVNFLYESINSFNKQLKLGRYIFTDIYREGVIVYEDGDFELTKPTILPWSKIQDIAQFDYDYWLPNGKEFIIDCKNCIERKIYPKAAFELHQATESFYNAILLVFEGYKPKIHELAKLRRRCKRYSKDVVKKVFSGESEEQREAFKLLCEAYIGGRYDRNYKITSEQLHYLIEEVEKLQAIAEKICLERLSLNDFPRAK